MGKAGRRNQAKSGATARGKKAGQQDQPDRGGTDLDKEAGQQNQPKSGGTALHMQNAEQQDKPKSGRTALDMKTTPLALQSRKIREPLEPVYDEIPRFREFWERCYGRYFGSFEDITVVPPMCYTDTLPIPKLAVPDFTLQVFSVKIAKEKEDLHWPLHVFGLIAVRDSIDPRRNLIFHRDRDNCQTITEEEPFLLLTGPYRAPVIIDPARIEVQLKAKGQTLSEDKDLIFNVLATWHPVSYSFDPPCMFTRSLYGIRSSLEFKLAVLAKSVEATIRVRVINGSWQGGMSGRVSARTASIDHGDIVLLDSGDGLVPKSRGFIELSRRVVSVELSGELKVVVEAKGFNEVIEKVVTFKPKDFGASYATLKFTFCALGVTAAWSKFMPLVPGLPDPAFY